MIIRKAPEIRAHVLDTIRASMDKEGRQGIHLSDLLHPKRACWQKVEPKPLTNDEILYFLQGRSHEAAFLHVSALKHGEQREHLDILYTPDIFQGFPCESKTRRAFPAEEGREAEVYDLYLRQVKGYCALSDIDMGWLHVWTVAEKVDASHKTKPGLHCYEVRFDREELREYLKDLVTTKVILERAIDQRTPHILPDCETWMCGAERVDVVIPPHCMTCKKDFASEANIQKHINSKSGQGHEIRAGEYKRSWEKRCKWFDECKAAQ